MPLYIQYPSWIHPEIFPGLPVIGVIRWYGLMYVLAFATAFLVMKRLLKEKYLDSPGVIATEDDLFSFFAAGIICLLIGARIFSTLVYDTSGIYLKKPWLIFWPFDESGRFTGLAGMSYHGGYIGGLLGMIFWCLRHKRPLTIWIDAMTISIPLGYTFGRIGNFLNGELFGRITTMPWGMVFPSAQKFSAALPWVQDFAAQIGMDIPTSGLVNLPRHPSQIYEAIFEGVVLWAILWFLRKKRPFPGFIMSLYTIGYGLARFTIEYFREPDADLGYRFAQVSDAPIYLNVSLLNISTGQVLSLIMILFGFLLLVLSALHHRRQQKRGLLKQGEAIRSKNASSKKKH